MIIRKWKTFQGCLIANEIKFEENTHNKINADGTTYKKMIRMNIII